MVNCGIYAAYCYVKENIDGYKSLGPNFDEQFQRLGFLKSNEPCGDNGIALRMQYSLHDFKVQSIEWGGLQTKFSTSCLIRGIGLRVRCPGV